MTTQRSESDPVWTDFLQELADYAPTAESKKRCLHLRPAWDRFQVQRLHQETLEMQALLHKKDPFGRSHLNLSSAGLKKLGQQAGLPIQDLKEMFSLAETLTQWLQNNPSQHLNFWAQSLKPDPQLVVALQNQTKTDSKLQQLLKKKEHLLQQQLQALDDLGCIAARARFAKNTGHLPQVAKSSQFELSGWQPAGMALKHLLHLKIPTQVHGLILSGEHHSGKTRLLQALYLSALMHQSGIPIACDPSSQLPVFAGIWYLPAQQNLQRRLEALKPLLKSKQAERLILIDDFPAASNAGEAHALGRAVLDYFVQHKTLCIVASHDQLLLRHSKADSPLQSLALDYQGSRKQGSLSLSWNQKRRAELFKQASSAGWPLAIMQSAEKHYKDLLSPTQGQPAAAKSKAVAKPPAKVAKPSPVQVQLQKNVPVGSWVYLHQLNQYGELLSAPDRKGRVQVLCQGISMQIPADQVSLSSKRQEKKGESGGVRIQTWSVSSEVCDLHGMTVDEALPIMEKFLDVAFQQGLNPVRVIHGKGTSKLRQAVHMRLEELQKETGYIRSFRLGHHGEGDFGVTVVELRL